MARPPGLEPGTFGLEIRCSIQLSTGAPNDLLSGLLEVCPDQPVLESEVERFQKKSGILAKSCLTPHECYLSSPHQPLVTLEIILDSS